MLGGADNPNGELPSYITGANTKIIRSDSDTLVLILKPGLSDDPVFQLSDEYVVVSAVTDNP